MKNFIVFVFVLFLSFGLYGQWADNCVPPIDPPIASFPTSVVCNTSGFSGGDGYTATSFGANPYVTGFYSFSVSQSGYYNISFVESGGSPASGDLSVAFGTACPNTESDFGPIAAIGGGFMITSGCPYLTAGTSYYVAAASQVGTEGEFTLTISQGEDVCEGALPVVLGDNLLNNNCSMAPQSATPGSVWSTFTVQPVGPNSNYITVDLEVTNPPAGFSVLNVYLDDGTGCATAIPLSLPYKCFNAGDILYIESGNNGGPFGDYTLNITETYFPVPNDDCVGATNLGTLSCTGALNGTSDTDACTTETDCAGNTVEGVWYRFTVLPSVYTFSFVGTEFRVYTGPDCLNLTSLGCAGDASLTGVEDNPATTYWVMVYGAGNFSVTSDDPVPANSQCSSAITLNVGDNPGTNVCASADLSFCSINSTDDHLVYYSYFNSGATYVDLNLTFTAISSETGLAADNVSIQALSACPNTAFPGFTPVCDGYANGAVINCLAPGSTVYFAVGSEEGDEGDFNINLTVNPNPLINNDCDGAIDWGTLASSCQVQNFAGLDNSGACPDTPPASGPCNFSNSDMHGVWYSFTTDADAEKADLTTNLTNASFALYTGSCGSLNYVNGSCTSGGGDLIDFIVTPNTTYYLLISSNNEETFNVDITIKNTPDNNLCADAITLTNGVTVEGTNACADAEVNYCLLTTGNSHQVYYIYTNNTGGNVDIDVSISSSTATTGTAANSVSLGVLTGCPGTFHPVYGALQCDETLPFTNQDIDCIEDGETLIFVVGSEDGDEGDFTIEIAENPNNVTNDECSGAIEITGWTECEWFDVSGTNANACPEDFDAGGCGYDQNPVVWLSFTPNEDGTVEIDNFTAAGTGFLGIFDETIDCDNPTPLADCNTEGTDPFGPFNVTGGSTYLIAVGSNGGEGNFDFDIKINKTLNHDDPCATGFSPLVITGDYTDDNTCATQDIDLCGTINNTNGKTLFYEYTMTQDADLEISVAGIGAAGPFYLGVYEAVSCGTSTLILEDCDADVTIPCLEAGQTVIIMVATTNIAGAFGQYDITINESTPTRPVNDECENAEIITYTDADLCQWIPVQNGETNINACSEDFTVGTCQYDVEEVVWYSITVPPGAVTGADLNIRFSNYSGTGELFATFFNDNCTTPPALSACFTGNGPHVLADVVANTTYLIGVGSSGDDGGSFDMEVNITSGPPNDDACADLTAYDLTGGVTLTNQFNSCSVENFIFPECNAADQTNAVIYQFTISDPNYGIHIDIIQNGADPIKGEVVVGISEVNDDFCGANPEYIPPAYCSDISSASFDFICLMPGTYQLQFSSSDNSSGTFEISSQMIEKIITVCNQNDECEDATELTVSDYCTWTDFTNKCNTDACPDPVVEGACDLTLGPTVWYKILIPLGAAVFDANLDNSSFQNPLLLLVDACDATLAECATPSTNSAAFANPFDISAFQGQYVYLAVSDPNGNGGTYDLHVKIDVPPDNDDPCETDENPPVALTEGNGVEGTTCCSTVDFSNEVCGSNLDRSVWYTYTPVNTSGGITINVSPGTIQGNVAVEAYWGDDLGCTESYTSLAGTACGALPAEINFAICGEPVEKIYIKVASTEDDCGTFTITVDEDQGCTTYADACDEISGSFIVEPIADGAPICVTTCNTYACSEGGDCNETNGHSVWIQINTDNQTSSLIINLQGADFNPLVTFFAGDDCSTLATTPSGINCSPGTVFTAGAGINRSYWLRIESADGSVDDNFDVCITALFNVYDCYDIALEVSRPDYPDLNPNGPYCPGEHVRFCYEIEFDVSSPPPPNGNNCQWIQGIIPSLGPAWDLVASQLNLHGPGGGWFWLDENNVDYNFNNNNYEVYVHPITGQLVLSYTYGPNAVHGGDLLPGGWWFTSNGGSGCANNGDPDTMWGVPSSCTNTQNVDFCVDIIVKQKPDIGDCDDPNYNDLSLDMFVFADGETGCWMDLSCALSIPSVFNGVVECDVPERVIAENLPVCSGTEFSVDLALEFGGGDDIFVEYDSNNPPYVSGGHNDMFSGGSGTLTQTLTITDENICDSVQVNYFMWSVNPLLACPGKIDTLTITVFPLPKLKEQEIPGLCFDELPYSLSLIAECGYPGDYIFEWSDNVSGKNGIGNNVIIDKSFGVGSHLFSVSITDELGCENIVTLEFNIYDEVKFSLEGATLCWGTQKEFIPEFFGSDVSSDFTYDWYWETGDGSNSTDPTYSINEQDYGNFYYPGTHRLCLIVYETHDDGIVCQADTCVDVVISSYFNLHLDPYPAYICAGQSCVDIELVFNDENGIKYDDVADIAWNGSSGGDVVQEFCNVSYGNFVNVRDLIGCDTIIYFDIQENSISPLNITGDIEICEGQTTTLTVSEDFDTYIWNTGDVSKSITVSPSETTTYTVSAVNNSGCVSTGEITVEVFSAEVPDIPASVSFCTGYSATYTAPAGYASYTWYFGSTSTSPVSNTATVVMNQAGNYILVVTTSIGCIAQNTIKATQDTELSPVVFGDFLLCFEEPTAKVWASGGTFTKLQWRYTDKNGNLVPNTTDKDTVNLTDGKYYVWVSDGNCAGDTTFRIVRKPKILPKIIPDDDAIKLCFGQTTTLTAPPGYSHYQWSSGQFTQIISNVGKGKYYLTVTDADGCVGVDSINVFVYPRLIPKLQNNINICDNESVWLKPGDFDDYKWYKNSVHMSQYDGADSIQVSESALFVVQVFNEIGCTAYDTTRVIKDLPVVPVILGIVDLCDDDQIVLSSSQNYSKYKWTNSDGKVLSTAKTCNFTMTPGKNTEQVTLFVENSNGCTGTVTNPVNRYSTPPLRLSSVIPTVCGKNTTSGNTILDFSTYFITGTNSGGTWTELDASGATHNANWTQVDFSNVQYGKTYRFVFTTNTAHAPCTNVKDTLFVSVIECICDNWYISSFTDVCNDPTSAEININTHIVDKNGVRITPPPPGTWTVLNGTSNLINGINFVPANAPSKTYTLQYKLTNIGNYCVDTATVTITVQNSVKPGNPLPFSICAGTDVLIRLDSMLVGESAGGVWSETSVSPSTGNAFKANAGTFTTAGQSAGTYTFKYYLDAVAPCPDADATVTIIIDPVPSANAGPDQTVCFEDKPVKLSTNSVGTIYSWRLKGTTDILADSKELSVNQSGTYVLRVQTGKGCFREDEVNVTIKDQILVNISGTTLLRNGERDTLFATYTGRNVGDNLTYTWTKNGDNIDQSNNNFIIVSEAGNYCVDIEDEQNCIGSDCHVVGVELTKEINMPNIFSPDGDSKNDRFFVKDGKNVAHIRNIKLYDRWGELVWSDGDYAFANRFDHFWDGVFKGKKAMQGVYVYLVEFTWSDGEEDFVAGDVTLVR